MDFAIPEPQWVGSLTLFAISNLINHLGRHGKNVVIKATAAIATTTQITPSIHGFHDARFF
jgi:hypothetical protein